MSIRTSQPGGPGCMPRAGSANIFLFPMNQQAQDLMMGAPGEADPNHLQELNIRVQMPVEAKKAEE